MPGVMARESVLALPACCFDADAAGLSHWARLAHRFVTHDPRLGHLQNISAGQQTSSGPEADSDGAASGEPAEQAAQTPLKARKAITRTRAEQRARRRQQQKVAQQRYRRDTSLALPVCRVFMHKWTALKYSSLSTIPSNAEGWRRSFS